MYTLDYSIRRQLPSYPAVLAALAELNPNDLNHMAVYATGGNDLNQASAGAGMIGVYPPAGYENIVTSEAEAAPAVVEQVTALAGRAKRVSKAVQATPLPGNAPEPEGVTGTAIKAEDNPATGADPVTEMSHAEMMAVVTPILSAAPGNRVKVKALCTEFGQESLSAIPADLRAAFVLRINAEIAA